MLRHDWPSQRHAIRLIAATDASGIQGFYIYDLRNYTPLNMARPLRPEHPGVLWHVTAQNNGRKVVVQDDDAATRSERDS